MFSRQSLGLLIGLLLMVSLLSACGGQPTAPAVVSNLEGLKEIPEVYKYLAYQKQPPPARLDDLNPFIDTLPNAFSRLQTGEYILVWGVGLSQTPEAAKTVLAYEKKVPSEGGAVLLANGTVREMTAAEFQEAPKAKR